MSDVKKQALFFALVTAIEGGSNYWCCDIDFITKDYNSISLETFCDRTEPTDSIICWNEYDESFSVTREEFISRVTYWIPEWIALFSSSEFDAIHADNFLQHGMLNDIIYG